MKNELSIVVDSPRPFGEVGIEFCISGLVPKDWIKDDICRVDLKLIDLDCHTILGSSISVNRPPRSIAPLVNRYSFFTRFKFHFANIPFLKKSQGRMAIQLSGDNGSNQSILIPFIVKGFEPKNGVDSEVTRKHKALSKTLLRYESDLREYNIRLSEICKRREDEYALNKIDEVSASSHITDEIILTDIFEILESEEDQEISALEESFREALDWIGPRCAGSVPGFNGFHFTVHSHDHDQHFHIIHKGKGVDARFSFPGIKLIDYKVVGRGIGSKEQKAIYKYFENEDRFNKLKSEFTKRESLGSY